MDHPKDYEACGECGFDHSYEPQEAHASHQELSSKTTLTHEDLKAAGFLQYETSTSNATTNWQRIQRGEHNEKLYFVNVEEWELEKSDFLRIDLHDYIVKCVMYPEGVGDDEYGVRLQFNIRTVDELESVESFLHNFFLHHNCPPDIHNI